MHAFHAALAALLLPATATAQQAIPSDTTLTVAAYLFVSRAGDTVAAELGRLRVPENRRASSVRTIALAFVRFPLRRVLGVERVVLWGASYGTHLALAALRRHPTLAAPAILAGAEGPDDTFKLPSSSDRQLDTIASLVHADTALRVVIPDVRATLRRVLTRLDRAPATVRLADPNASPTDTAATDSLTLVIDGASHGDALFLASPAIPRAMLDFLAGRPTPARVSVPFRLAPDLSALLGNAP